MYRCYRLFVAQGTCSVSQISPFKSTAFRITLIYVLLFSLSVMILLGFFYWSTVGYLTRQTDETINAEISQLSDVYRKDGVPGLSKELTMRVKELRPGDDTLYLLTDTNFKPLLGNIDRWPNIAFNMEEGWLEFKLDDNKDDSPKVFMARARTFEVANRFNLLVGHGMKDLRNFKSLIFRTMLWGLVITIGLALIGGLMMRRTLTRRLWSINQTSRKIMLGDLRKRVETRGTGDEFDELADNLNGMLDQIERGVEGVRRVSDNIAHDLKTPLARLKNKVEELRMQVNGDEKKEIAVDNIVSEADGLLATFNALLRIARIESSEKREGFRKIDITSILHDIQELYEPVIEEKNQTLEFDVQGVIMMMADRDMLFQVFANLVDNAIKYTPRKGAIRISAIQAKNKRDNCRIEIADNGPGIPESEYENITKRFYRLDESRSTPGSGLGLALASAVIRLHKMNMRFKSNLPGLCVVIEIPQSIIINTLRHY